MTTPVIPATTTSETMAQNVETTVVHTVQAAEKTISGAIAALITPSHFWMLILLAIIIGGGKMYLDEHDRATKAEAAIVTLQKTIDSAKQDIATVQTQLASQLAPIQAQMATPATPQQIIVDVSKLIPSLPAPITTVAIPPAPGALPNAPQSQEFIVPSQDFTEIRDAELTCQADELKLGACTKTNTDLNTELTATTTQRDVAVTALKGGTFLQRLGKAAKCLAASGGGAALGAVVDKNHPAEGAMLGVLGGTIGCQFKW